MHWCVLHEILCYTVLTLPIFIFSQLPLFRTTMCAFVIPVLPVEIITEILLKLPPKPLLKCKCVSKSWLQLISSPQFVKTHIKLTANNKEFSHHRVIFPDSKNNFKVCYLPSLFRNDKSTEVVDMDSPNGKTPLSCWNVDSTNGLVCLFIGSKEGILWNPTIRKSKKVPNLQVKIKSGSYYRYGFGYDEAHDDYKVVVIQCISDENGGSYDIVVNIYCLRTDSWITVNKFVGYFLSTYSSKFVNGKIYWPSCASSAGVNGHEFCDIISLDLTNQAWAKLEIPTYGEGKSKSGSILEVIFLSLLQETNSY